MFFSAIAIITFLDRSFFAYALVAMVIALMMESGRNVSDRACGVGKTLFGSFKCNS